ncbi:MAG: tachylectin-related carbohydrate-binding protein [Stackebrandtia sp.]
MHAEQVLARRYRLDERIGFGGMGEVWRGTDLSLGRAVAVKVLRPDQTAGAELRQRFFQEARTLAALNVPGAVQVHDFGEDESDGRFTPFLVMEYISGRTLSQLVAERGTLPAAEILGILAKVARSLEVAHQAGIIHRDIKPGNIIVGDDGKVTLLDFGIAMSANHTRHTESGQIMGTLSYASPEQLNGSALSPASDVYSLGAVAYECLAGRVPFGGDPLATITGHLHHKPPSLPDSQPPEANRIVTRALAKAPTDRYGSAAEFSGACEAFIAGVKPTRRLPLWRPTRRRVGVITAVLLLAAAGLVVTLKPWQSSSPADEGGESTQDPAENLGMADGQLLDSGDGVLYELDENGDLYWYRHTDPKGGSVGWAEKSGKRIDSGWRNRVASAGCKGVLYSLGRDGKLYWYRHEDTEDGTRKWSAGSGSVLGDDFGQYTRLFANSDGSFYAVTPNGGLVWYRHTDPGAGKVEWAEGSGLEIGSGWDPGTAVAAGGCDGVLYATHSNGDLIWAEHQDQDGGNSDWQSEEVNSGWDRFDSVVASDSGTIYARTPDGRLYWFRHLEPETGREEWSAEDGKLLGSG